MTTDQRAMRGLAELDLPADVLEILAILHSGVQQDLGENLIGAYLRGSLVTEDFEPGYSDLDLMVATRHAVSETEFDRLRMRHEKIGLLDNPYALQLEVAYLDQGSLRRYVPCRSHPTTSRGSSTLQSVEHGTNWVLERWTLRELGVALSGPNPASLIDRVTGSDLRHVVHERLADWARWADTPDDPDWQLPLKHKSYVVETMCRALYTLQFDRLASKRDSVAWAVDSLPEPWRSAVRRSAEWRGRESADPSVNPEVARLVAWTAEQASLRAD